MFEIISNNCTSLSSITSNTNFTDVSEILGKHLMYALPQLISETSQIGALILCTKEPNLYACASKLGTSIILGETSRLFLNAKPPCSELFQNTFRGLSDEFNGEFKNKTDHLTGLLRQLENEQGSSLGQLTLEERKIVDQIKLGLNSTDKKVEGYFNAVSKRVSTILDAPKKGVEWLTGLTTTRRGFSFVTNVAYVGGTIVLGAMGIMGINRGAQIVDPAAVHVLAARLGTFVEIGETVLAYAISQIYNHALRNFAFLATGNTIVKVLDSLEHAHLNQPLKVDAKLADVAIKGHLLETFIKKGKLFLRTMKSEKLDELKKAIIEEQSPERIQQLKQEVEELTRLINTA